MKTELIENLSLIKHPLDRAKATLQFQKELPYKEILNKLEKEKLQLAIQILSHSEFQKLVDKGYITLGAIKPHTEESKLEVNNDLGGEEKLIKLIQTTLSIVFSISFCLSKQDIISFYPTELRENLSLIPSEISNLSLWEAYVNYMASGPVTYLILYDDNHQAILKWREQMGSTNPSEAKIESIRKRYAISTRKNLVHGSANLNDLRHEIDWLLQKLKEICN